MPTEVTATSLFSGPERGLLDNVVLQHDNGIMYGTGYDKQSLRLNVTHLAGSKLQIKANFNVAHSLTKRGISNNDNINVTPYFVFPATPSFFDFRPGANGVYPKNPFLSQGTNPLQTLSLFSLPEDSPLGRRGLYIALSLLALVTLVSSTIFALPNKVCAANRVATSRGNPAATPPSLSASIIR